VNREISRTGGKIVVREGVPLGEAIQFPLAGSRANMGWQEFAVDMQNNTDRLSTNPNSEGAAQSSQESSKVVESRVKANTKKFTPYMNTYHDFDLRVTRKMLMMIPYAIKEQTIFRHVDENNNMVQVEVNKPVERDMMTGDPTRIVNNLLNAKYDYIAAVTDDSMDAKEFEIAQFLEITRDNLQYTPQEFWIPMLRSVGNRFALKYADKLEEVQEQMKEQEPPKEPMKISFSINSEDVTNNKLIQSILVSEGVLDPAILQQFSQQQPQAIEQNQGVPDSLAGSVDPALAGQAQPQLEGMQNEVI